MSLSSAIRKSLSAGDRLLVEHCESLGSPQDCSVGPPKASLITSDTSNQFLIWFPAGLPNGSSISIASSRLSQKLDEHCEWFDALRTLAVQTSGEASYLITAKGTTTDLFVRRLAELFQIRSVIFERFPRNPARKWYRTQFENSQSTQAHQVTAYFKQLDTATETQNKLNVNDLLLSIATTSILLSVRKGGKVFKAAQRRLNSENRTATRLLINRRLTSKPVETLLMENGATGWWLYGDSDDSCDENTNLQRECSTSASSLAIRNLGAKILSIDEIKTENYLLHWTRRKVGPWPDQTDPEYLDDLIFQTTRRNHGEMSALCRILASGRIFASNHLTRDPRPVVCFSGLPLEKISARRTFRSHLSRWDFEPFGIAIERELLQDQGAQPVIYGTESDWDQLADHDRPFFQLKKSQSDKIDWELEQEWRIIGDLKLDVIPFDQAIVFVKTETAAEIVAGLSRWPLVILG